MSYVAPVGSAANFSFVPSQAYTAPLGGAVDFVFNLTPQGAGFNLTAFGTPLSVVPTTQSVSSLPIATSFGLPAAPKGLVRGFLSTQFGFPAIPTKAESCPTTTSFGTPARQFGIYSTRFGTASLSPSYARPVEPTTSFGTGFTRGGHWAHTSSAPSTVISLAYTAFPQTGVVTGWAAHRPGTPQTFLFGTFPTGLTCAVRHISATTFGKPSAAASLFSTATSVSPAFSAGTPHVDITGKPISFNGTAFGTAAAFFEVRGTGFRATSFGTAKAGLQQTVLSAIRLPRFGAASTERSNTFGAFGINVTNRFGHPSARSRLNRLAAGIGSARVGQGVTCSERHLTRHIAPTVETGTPRLVRTSC